MVGRWTTLTMAIVLAALCGCGGSGGDVERPDTATSVEAGSDSLPVEGAASPSFEVSYHFRGLPRGWTYEARRDDRIMLYPEPGGTSWIVSSIEPLVPANDLEFAITLHREHAQSSDSIKHRDSGVVDTAALGEGAWSVIRSNEDGEMRDELALFVRHPATPQTIALRYCYPSSDELAARLNLLVETANGIVPGDFPDDDPA